MGKHCSSGWRVLWMALLALAAAQSRVAHAAACTTQAQMPAAQREALSSTAHTILTYVQSGNVAGMRAVTSPAVAAEFDALNQSVNNLRPMIETATITIDEVYLLDASDNASASGNTAFYCGSPVVVVSVPGLPAGTYALALVHATGVPHPQQVALILSNVPGHGWMLAGMMDKPMTEAGHDGLWYWESARKYAQTRMNWDSWFYYRVAQDLLDPLDSISSPNLEKLRHEADEIRPGDLPGKAPMSFYARGMLFTVISIDTSAELGGLDLSVHYTPDATQAAQLRDPASARQQVTAVMTALLTMHPELRQAFHGIWVNADQGNASLFALELPMEQITASSSNPGVQTGAGPR
jgi:hypothetical protein